MCSITSSGIRNPPERRYLAEGRQLDQHQNRLSAAHRSGLVKIALPAAARRGRATRSCASPTRWSGVGEVKRRPSRPGWMGDVIEPSRHEIDRPRSYIQLGSTRAPTRQAPRILWIALRSSRAIDLVHLTGLGMSDHECRPIHRHGTCCCRARSSRTRISWRVGEGSFCPSSKSPRETAPCSCRRRREETWCRCCAPARSRAPRHGSCPDIQDHVVLGWAVMSYSRRGGEVLDVPLSCAI